MRKTQKSWKRLLAFIMVAMMMNTSVVPATAADNDKAPYTITIVPKKNTLKPTGDNVDNEDSLRARFSAYAIFTGDITKTGSNEYDEKDGDKNTSDDHKNPHTPPTANQLANVVWGAGIKDGQYQNLLNALVSDSTAFSTLGVNETDLGGGSTTLAKVKALGDEYASLTASSTLGDFFTAALKTAGYEVSNNTVSVPSTNPNGLSLANSAAVIAKAISDLNDATNTGEAIPNNNSALAQAFAKILATKTSGSYTYLNTATTSTWNNDLAWGTGENAGTGAWEIKNLDKAGYYLIIDNLNASNPDTTTEYDENSDYILGVFGDQTINLKSNAATVAKDIVTTGGLKKADSAGISDTVTFRLTGTLPENYDNYTTFKYIFHDTLSSGFTYDTNSLNVYLKNGENIYRITDTNVYTLNPTSYTNGNLTITFNNLKAIDNEDVSKVTSIGQTTGGSTVEAPFAIGQTCEVIVQYTAKVNQSTIIGAPAASGQNPPARNKNEVWLEYSNDVNDLASTGRTTTQTAYVYTYGLDIDKINGAESNVSKNALAGAGFALTRQNNGKTEYAVFTRTENSGSYTYKLVGWVEDGDWTSSTTWLNGVNGGNAPLTTGFDSGTTYYLAVQTIDTDANGNPTLKVEGLDAGNFTLKEVVTPDGFNTMKDIDFTITAEFSTPAGDNLVTLTGAETPDRNDVKFSNGNTTTGIIPVALTNTPAGFLPGTGGIGTTIFYILGGLLIVGAVVYMIFSRRKNKEEQ